MGASLIPRVDTLRSLGIVWIPGIMAGMILSASDPVYAAMYQFAVLAMILAAAGIASVITVVLPRHRAFSVAAQLTLRPGQVGQGARQGRRRRPVVPSSRDDLEGEPDAKL